MTIRVLVADDHAAVRLGLVMILSGASHASHAVNAAGTDADDGAEEAEHIEVVGEAGDGAEAVRLARALRPDVVLMDVPMPGIDGIAATRELVGDRICEVLVLTTFDLDDYVHEALRAGAAGFLLKSVAAPRLIEAVRLVAAGDGVLEPRVTRRLLHAFATATAPSVRRPAAVDQLTARERDVLRCLGEGLSNAQIGRQLFITEATVKTHVSRVLAKLDLRSRVQAAILAQDVGLLRDA